MFSRFIYSFMALFFAVFMIFAVPTTSFADGHEGTVPEVPDNGEDHPSDAEAPPEEGEDGEESPEVEEPKPDY